jgi:glycosyltransferase involved in cell wall biosynthesis
MRIWHLTKTLSGGAGQYALRLSNALRAQGMESSVLVAEGPVSDGAAELRRVDSPIRRFAARGFRSLSHRISLGPFHSVCGPERYESPHTIQAGDIVHLHGMTGWIGVSGLRNLIPRGAKVFWTAHDVWMLTGGCVVYQGCDQFHNDCSKCPILRAPWKRLAQRELRVKQAFINAYQVRPIANSQWMASRIRESRLFNQVDSIPIIPPIVDVAYLAEDIPDLRRELAIAEDRKVISLGARSLDDKFKGITEFLAQLSQTAELAGQLTVLLFGPGKIEIPANLDVRLLGNIIDPRQLAKVYRTSDVYVSSSYMETFGMTLVEAQACGTPVVAFDVGGVRDAMQPESHRWLEPTSRLDNLVQRLNQRLQHNGIERNHQNYLWEWAKHSFGAESLARAQLLAYQRVDEVAAEVTKL